MNKFQYDLSYRDDYSYVEPEAERIKAERIKAERNMAINSIIDEIDDEPCYLETTSKEIFSITDTKEESNWFDNLKNKFNKWRVKNS